MVSINPYAQPSLSGLIEGEFDYITVNGDIDCDNITCDTVTAGISVTAPTVSATNLTGTLTTAAQPNVTSVGTLSSLNVGGQINTDTAYKLNGVDVITSAGIITNDIYPKTAGNILNLRTTGALNYFGGDLRFGNGTNNRILMSSNSFTFTNFGQTMIYSTGGTQRVGIRTTSPTQNFDVNGESRFRGTVYLDAFELRLRPPTDANHFLGWKGTGNTFAGLAPNGPALVGFGGGLLGTTGGGQNWIARWTTTQFLTNRPVDITGSLTVSGDVNVDSGVLFVDSVNNRVGINDATPSYELDVTGQVQITQRLRMDPIRIGTDAGDTSVTVSSIGIGPEAQKLNPAVNSIGIGDNAGAENQGNSAVAIGIDSGYSTQGSHAVSLGAQAGEFSQGANSVAVGRLAGQLNQHANTIILNASGSAVNSDGTSRFFVDPIRSVSGIGIGVLQYNSTTKEITYSNTPDINGYVNLTSGGDYRINNISVLSSTTLGTGIVNSSLTSVGTLSSLTVSGNLTVDTNTLVVDAANNRVGIGITTPDRGLHYRGDSFRMDRNGNTSGFQIHRWDSTYTNVWKGYQLGVDASASNTGEFFIGDYGTALSGSSTRRMTINNTGQVIIPQSVAIGTTNNPAQTLDVRGNFQVYNSSLLEASLFVDNANLAVGVLTTTPGFPLHIVSSVNEPLCIEGTNTTRCAIKWKASSGDTEYEVGVRGTSGSPDNSFYIYHNKRDNINVNQYRLVILENDLGTVGLGRSNPDSNFIFDTCKDNTNGFIKTQIISFRVKRNMSATNIAPNTSMVEGGTVDWDQYPLTISNAGWQTSGAYNGMWRAPVTGYYQFTINCRFSDGSGGTKGIVPKRYDGTNYYNILEYDDNTFWCPEDGNRRCGSLTDMVRLNAGNGLLPTTYNGQNMEWAFMSVMLVHADA